MEADLKTRVLIVEDFEAATKVRQQECEAWLCGTISAAGISSFFEREVNIDYQIRGYTNYPDNFDYDSLPTEFVKRCEYAQASSHMSYRLLWATYDAATAILTKPMSRDDPIERAFLLVEKVKLHQFER